MRQSAKRLCEEVSGCSPWFRDTAAKAATLKQNAWRIRARQGEARATSASPCGSSITRMLCCAIADREHVVSFSSTLLLLPPPALKTLFAPTNSNTPLSRNGVRAENHPALQLSASLGGKQSCQRPFRFFSRNINFAAKSLTIFPKNKKAA